MKVGVTRTASILVAWLRINGFALSLLLTLPAAHGLAQSAGTWLDRPMQGWNSAGGAIPSARSLPVASSATLERCKVAAPPGLPAATPNQGSPLAGPSLPRAGWRPYLHQDRALARLGIEIIGGLTDMTQTCEPVSFNLFVFVDGRFAGTLAPAPMTTARDGAVGAVRIVSDTALTAEFARYAASDSECCPSSRVKVTYRIDRGQAPIVTPVSSQTLR